MGAKLRIRQLIKIFFHFWVAVDRKAQNVPETNLYKVGFLTFYESTKRGLKCDSHLPIFLRLIRVHQSIGRHALVRPPDYQLDLNGWGKEDSRLIQTS